MLAFANPQLPYLLHVDASREGLRGVLYQEKGESLRPLHCIAFISCSLTPSERHYPTHKLEYLALKWAAVDRLNDFTVQSLKSGQTTFWPMSWCQPNLMYLVTAGLQIYQHMTSAWSTERFPKYWCWPTLISASQEQDPTINEIWEALKQGDKSRDKSNSPARSLLWRVGMAKVTRNHVWFWLLVKQHEMLDFDHLNCHILGPDH